MTCSGSVTNSSVRDVDYQNGHAFIDKAASRRRPARVRRTCFNSAVTVKSSPSVKARASVTASTPAAQHGTGRGFVGSEHVDRILLRQNGLRRGY